MSQLALYFVINLNTGILQSNEVYLVAKVKNLLNDPFVCDVHYIVLKAHLPPFKAKLRPKPVKLLQLNSNL